MNDRIIYFLNKLQSIANQSFTVRTLSQVEPTFPDLGITLILVERKKACLSKLESFREELSSMFIKVCDIYENSPYSGLTLDPALRIRVAL